jgi:hypothetical protein
MPTNSKTKTPRGNLRKPDSEQLEELLRHVHELVAKASGPTCRPSKYFRIQP